MLPKVREQPDQRQPLRQPDPGRAAAARAREALHDEDAEGHRQGPPGEEGLCPQVQGQQPGKNHYQTLSSKLAFPKSLSHFMEISDEKSCWTLD